MQINLTEDWRIKADKHNFILQEKKIYQSGEHIGEVYWEADSYFQTIDGLLNNLHLKMLRASDASTLSQALAESKRITTELLRSIASDLTAFDNEYCVNIAHKDSSQAEKSSNGVLTVEIDNE